MQSEPASGRGMNALTCPECPSSYVIEDRQSGDAVCTGCGLVLEAHAWDSSCLPTGDPMQTVLASQTIGNCPRRLLYASGDSSRARSTIAGTCDLRSASADLGLPSGVADLAARSWESICDEHTCRGDVRDAVRAACIYYACKLFGVPRTKGQLRRACHVTPDLLQRALKLYRHVIRPPLADDVLMSSPTESKDLLAAVVQATVPHLVPSKLQRRVTAQARMADDDISKTGVLEGKTPRVRATAAVGLALERLQLPGREQLAKAAGVSQYTLSRTLALARAHIT